MIRVIFSLYFQKMQEKISVFRLSQSSLSQPGTQWEKRTKSWVSPNILPQNNLFLFTQKLNAVLVNRRCFVGELTRRSMGVSCKWKKKHTHRHTQMPFYLKPHTGTITASDIWLHLFITCTYWSMDNIFQVLEAKLRSPKIKSLTKSGFVW